METSVQIRVDFWGTDAIPHTFLSVTHPDGSTTEYGLVPKNGTLYDEGKIDITGPGFPAGDGDVR